MWKIWVESNTEESFDYISTEVHFKSEKCPNISVLDQLKLTIIYK